MIKIYDLIGDNFATDEVQGLVIYEAIKSKINEGVVVSFEHINLTSCHFLSCAFGQLYKGYSSEYLNKKINLIDISESIKIKLHLVLKNAKKYYNKQDELF